MLLVTDKNPVSEATQEKAHSARGECTMVMKVTKVT